MSRLQLIIVSIVSVSVLLVLATWILNEPEDLSYPVPAESQPGADDVIPAVPPDQTGDGTSAANASVPRWDGVEGSVVIGGCMGIPDIQVELRTPDDEVLRRTATDDCGRFGIELNEAVSLYPRLRLIVNPNAAAREWMEGSYDVSPDQGHLFVSLQPADASRRKLTFAFRGLPAVENARERIILELVHPNGRSFRYPVKPSEPELKVSRLHPGIYYACARFGSFVWSQAHIDLVANDEVLVDVVPEPGRTIIGRLVDGTGAGVVNFEVRLFLDPFRVTRSFSPGVLFEMGRDADASYFAGRRVQTDVDGAFQFENCPAAGLWVIGQAGTVCLSPTKVPDQRAGALECDLGDVCVSEGDAEVTVSVDAEKGFLEGSTLILAGGMFGWRRTPFTGERWVIGDVVPGDYLVCVSRETTQGRALISSRLTDWRLVSVEPGGKIDVDLPLLKQCQHEEPR